MRWLGKVVLSVITLMIVTLALAFSITYLMKDTTANVFELKSSGDWITVVIWLATGLGSMSYLGYGLKQGTLGKTRWIYQLVAVFLSAIFLGTICPLFLNDSQVNAKAVEKAVSNTYVFYYIVFGLLVVGFIASLIIAKDKLKKSNWVAFFLAIPYIVIGWKAQRAFVAFKELVLMDSFKENSVANMVKETHGELRMINSLWYELFTILVITLVLVIGVRMSEAVWKETSKRSKTDQKKEAC